LAGEREVKAQIKLCFKTMNGKLVNVVRNMQLTQRANGKLEYKFVDGSTKTKNEKGVLNHNKFIDLLLTPVTQHSNTIFSLSLVHSLVVVQQIVSQSYHCAHLDKLIPELMGVSKAILENVIFCHQEV
jgi:DNA repair protein RAD50